MNQVQLRFTCLLIGLMLSLTIPLAQASLECTDKIQGELKGGDGAGNWWHANQSIMGTEIFVELWHVNQLEACGAIHEVMAEMRRIDFAMSPYKENSLLSRLNQKGADGPVEVGEELYKLIASSLEMSKLTAGAFDVTYASVGRLYDYRSAVVPTKQEIERRLTSIDYRHVELHPKTLSISFKRAGVYLDLGGIAKGYAVDRGIALLRARGVTQAMVKAGGDSRIIGDRNGEPWVVGIKDPRVEGEMVAVLPLMNVSVSTSGDYERYFENGGIRYHHIINPKTGDSARQIQSVTILGDDTLSTDALSTSVFVMGVEKGLDLVNGIDGVDVVIVSGDGDLFYSDSLLSMTAGR